MQAAKLVPQERFSPSEAVVAKAAVGSRAPHLLIVEDDLDVGRGLVIRLGSLGYRTRLAQDGASALRKIEQDDPSLILLDLGLPGMHGMKLLHEMRMRGLSQPVIVLTASSDPALHERAVDLGALDVLSKPVDAVQLLNIIAGIVPAELSGNPVIVRPRRDRSVRKPKPWKEE